MNYNSFSREELILEIERLKAMVPEFVPEKKLAFESGFFPEQALSIPLREEEDKYRKIFLNFPLPCILLSSDNVITLCNKAFESEIESLDLRFLNRHIHDLLPNFNGGDINFNLELLSGKKRGRLLVRSFPLTEEINQLLIFDFSTQNKSWKEDSLKRQEKLKLQNKAVIELASFCPKDESDLETFLKAVCYSSASTLEIARVSAWFFNDDRTAIECKMLYEYSTSEYSKGFALQKADYPGYFGSLRSERVIVANDAQNDPHTKELKDVYLKPLGITSMMDAPIRFQGEIVALLCFEHIGEKREWHIDEQNFASSLADMTAIALEDIERIKAEKALRESEEKFRMLAENAQDIIYRFSLFPENKYEYIRPYIFELTGYTPEEFYNDPFLGFKIIHKDDLPNLGDTESIIREGHHLNQIKDSGITLRWVKKDGSVIWTETRNKPIFDETGRLIAIEGISRDITAQKKNELDLKDSEERFKLLSKAAMEGIALSEAGKIIDANDRFLQIFGYSFREEILDLPIADFIVRESLNSFRRNFSKPIELIGRKKDGSEIIIEASGQKIPYHGKRIRITTVSDITQRKKTELALRESERTYLTLLGNLPGMVYRSKADSIWSMSFVSEGGLELTGYTPEEILHEENCSFGHLIHMSDRQGLTDEISKKLKQRLPFEAEYRLIKRNGHVKWVWQKGEGVFNDNGELLFIEGFITDITERRQYELELEKSRESYKSLIESSPDGIFIHDEKGFVVFANPVALQILGFASLDDLNDINIFDYILPAYHDAVKNRKKLMNEGINLPYMVSKIKRNDGVVLELESKPISFTFFGKKSTLVFFRDISHYRQLEKEQLRAQLAEESNRKLQLEISERKKAENQLQANQQYTRRIIESSMDMICASDNQGLITEFNLAAQKTFGYSGEEMIGKPIDLLFADMEDVARVNNSMVEENGGGFVGEIINKKKSGETFISYLSASLLKNENGHVIGSMGVSRDITSLKKAEKELRESEEKYRAIYNQAYIGIARVGLVNGEFIEVNQRLCDILGYSHEELIGKTTTEISVPEDEFSVTDERKEFLRKKQDKLSLEKRYLHKNGTVIYANLTISLVRDTVGQPVFFVCVYEDITERKKAEEQLRRSEARVRAIINQAYIGIAQISLKGEFLEVNQQFSEMFGYSAQELLNLTFMDITHPENMDASLHALEAMSAGKSDFFTIEKQYFHKSGRVVYANLSVSLVKDNNGNPDYFVSVFHDITQKKEAEAQIQIQAAKLNAIIESSSHLIWTVNKNIALTSFNKNFTDLMQMRYGTSVSEGVIINRGTFVSSSSHNEFWNKKYSAAFKGSPQHFEALFEDSNGSQSWMEVYLNPIFNFEGKVEEVSGIGHDITEKKLSEEKLMLSLKEKEVLLKEVHHRVKNNLQVISSILNLQSSYVKDIKTLELLKESQNRIKSMAFIHESLYQTKDFSSINFSEYVTNLSKNLIHSYTSFENKIELELEVQQVFLNLDIAIPCGLIINELVSNALKYAFPKGSKGIVKIDLKSENNLIKLVISDNGVGLSRKIDFRNTDSLGLQLVVTLVEQLGGKIRLQRTKGSKFTISFNHQKGT